jgi:hypothetical protein
MQQQQQQQQHQQPSQAGNQKGILSIYVAKSGMLREFVLESASFIRTGESMETNV